MSLRNLPKVKAFERPDGLGFEPSPETLARWQPGVRAIDSESSDTTISIYDVIGADPWTGGGVTAKRIAAALRAIGDRDVVVNINSPGGDVFEGIAIYNLLRDHARQVTVRVMALAASAASVIAMAGDRIEIARAGFMMVHNVWVIALGNRHDLADAAAWLEPFDAALADVYAARSGQTVAAVAKMMDDETWINGSDAIAKGFADDYVPADQVSEDPNALAEQAPLAAVRRIDSILASHGLSRTERRSLIAEAKSGKPSAAIPAKHDAGEMIGLAAALQGLQRTISG